MRTLIALALAATAAAQGPAPASYCFEKYQCIFHHNVGSTEYSWDFHQLCDPTGNGYVFSKPSSGQTYQFNVCGLTNYQCIPQWPVYDNLGVAVQILSPAPSPNPGCIDTTGATVPCSGQCVVIGTPFFQFSLLDSTNPASGGVVFAHTGMPPDADDPFACSALTPNGLTQERQLSVMIMCDSSITGPLVVQNVTEPAPCTYLITAAHSAACGTKGDPFSPYRDDPAHSFGFVVLGSFLTIVTTLAIRFANARGWLDPIKRRIPACRIPGIGSLGGSGSGSYKTIAVSSGSASAATPITASAYGTA